MDLTQEQARVFVGPEGADYYLERWHRIEDEAGSRALGFNWAACFLTFTWLLYRRMYRWFWIGVAVLIALGIIEEIVVEAAYRTRSRGILLLIALERFITTPLLGLMFGMFGTYWYYLHARREVKRLTADGGDDLQALTRAGGTDLRSALLAAAVGLGLFIWGTALTQRDSEPSKRIRFFNSIPIDTLRDFAVESIVPTAKPQPFNDPAWSFESKDESSAAFSTSFVVLKLVRVRYSS